MEFTRHFGGDLRILGLNEKIAQLEAFEIKLNEWKLNLIGLNEKIAEPNLVWSISNDLIIQIKFDFSSLLDGIL